MKGRRNKMTEAIIYDSLSGNTETLAKEIKSIKKNAYYEKIYDKLIEELPEYDIYYIGSPIIKGICTDKIKRLLQKIENKKIFLFITTGYKGEDYYESLTRRILEIIPKSNQILGTFLCQGKMQDAVKERYIKLIQEHPEDKNLKVSIENFEQAKTHPDQKDKKDLIEKIQELSLT